MNIQQLFLLGRATKDAEVLESKEGKKYAKFSLAVNQYLGKDKDERPSFYNILVFNKSHERADKIKKGDLVMIDGRPGVDAYLDSEGQAKASITVFADSWKLIK